LHKYWIAFLVRNKLTAETNFASVVEKIKLFIEPLFESQQDKTWNSKDWKWK
jgi:hypothetical protein